MTAKEYLNRYHELDASINSLCDELAHWRAIATRITPPDKFNGRSVTPSDKVGQAVAKIIDLENRINAEIDVLVDMRDDIRNTISAVDDARLRQVLVSRYINFKKWEEIAEIMHTDLRWIYRLHGKALQKIKIDH